MTTQRAKRILKWTLGILGGLIVAAIAGILIWSQVGVMPAEAGPLAAVQDDPAIATRDTSAAIVLEPAEGSGEAGLVFIPGAKVDPWAYASKLSDLVTEEHLTVVISRPWLSLAFFDPRPLADFTSLAPDVETGWSVATPWAACGPASSRPTPTR